MRIDQSDSISYQTHNARDLGTWGQEFLSRANCAVRARLLCGTSPVLSLCIAAAERGAPSSSSRRVLSAGELRARAESPAAPA